MSSSQHAERYRASGGGKGGKGACPPGGAVQQRDFEGRKYGILKFDRFWQIGVCTADKQWYVHPPSPLTLPQFWDHTQLSVLHGPTQSSLYTNKLHCWHDWSFTRCKTVEDPYCSRLFYWQSQFNVLHFKCFQIMYKIWKFCMKFGQLLPKKIFKFVANRCQILRLKCTRFNFGWASAIDPTSGAYSAPPGLLAGFKGPTSKGGESVGKRDGAEWEWTEEEGIPKGWFIPHVRNL